ncbi:hypothetical protein BDM02DRAFT_3107651 [Thelephora ganbajun]|uniref:Uncharacterized protein n=1 Tax=Thelephora ganbajun TaxID=370292 RepID=A0ACB6ZW58_THEGA|nr:hypothetical protein BDM02DRAFT_3107651 [Thelephora ganbajun]
MSNPNDPRDASLETRVTFPKSWNRDEADALGSSNMMLSGLILITRNRLLAWPALLLAISGAVNQHPLRTKDGSTGITGLWFAISALIASYVPMILVTPPQVGQSPLQ